jgi:hypothetical protein
MITLSDLTEFFIPSLICKLFGHSKKLEQKMYCKICSRCSVVVEYEVGRWG